jgi:acyl-CoA synthetase (AMP-forming)/AMP-acid ligase II
MFWVARFRALACLDAGATLVLEELPPGEAMPGRIAALGITHLSGTPGHLHALVAAAAGTREGQLALPGIERLRASSAMVPEALRRAVRQRLTPHLHVNYGSNEAGPIAGGGPEALAAHPDSVGQPLPGIELELVDAAGRPVPQGAIGEVRLRGAGVAAGYVGNAAATRRAFRDGWFHPGDLAVRQADGTLVLKGRADDAMNWDGVLVLPADIERALLEHPAVADAAAFPLVSARFQHVPAAAVVLRGPATAAELQGFCRQALGAKAPPVIEVLPALPRNAAGKLLRREMAASLAAKLERRGAPLG